MTRVRAFLATIFLLLLTAAAPSQKNEPGLPLFAQVNDWLYRGAQPAQKGFAELKAKGIRTVVNFRNEPEWIEWERKEVEALEMNYISLPWRIWAPVKPELLDELFKVLDNPANRPVFIHCKHGRDRTGVMSILSLMRYENLSKEKAREKAFQMAKPHLRYRLFFDHKLKFFMEKRPVKASE